MSQWFFISFCLFFVFNLYAWRLSNTEGTLHHLLHYLSGKSRVNFPWLCSELFSLEACFFFLSRVYFLFLREFIFCRDVFLFCREIFSFVVTYFFSWPREFLFCRKFSSLPLTYFFFAVTLVGHRTFYCYQPTSKLRE